MLKVTATTAAPGAYVVSCVFWRSDGHTHTLLAVVVAILTTDPPHGGPITVALLED